MPLNLLDIESLFDQHGHVQYSGEPVTQLEHALQTAHLAEQAGADGELVTAALLHDLGHLLGRHAGSPTLQGVDDLHQYAVLPFLRGVFSDKVLDCIRLHVDAKRYLCAVMPSYHAGLSADSVRSLALQGGVFDAAGAQAFIEQTHATDAVALRQWDELAKDQAMQTPTLSHFLARAAQCMLR